MDIRYQSGKDRESEQGGLAQGQNATATGAGRFHSAKHNRAPENALGKIPHGSPPEKLGRFPGGGGLG